MVVEDDFLVAQFLGDWLLQQGAAVAGPVGWLDEALALLANPLFQLDAAVLDVNLHGENVYAVADALMARTVPFVFTTGFGADALIGRYARHPQLQKPVNLAALLEQLQQSLRGTRRRDGLTR